MEIKIQYTPIDELKPNEYNPKKLSVKELKDLEKSVTEFGIVDPLIANKAENRKGILIGGHQRYKVFKRLNFKEVPVIFLDIPDIEKEKELCLRLSKNTGSFDDRMLKELSQDLLKDVGFEESMLEKLFDDRIEGELDFSPEILEENNYIVFIFDNSIDWGVIEDKFKIKSVHAVESKPGDRRKGTGRVIDGKKLLELL